MDQKSQLNDEIEEGPTQPQFVTEVFAFDAPMPCKPLMQDEPGAFD
jgi:hypothetical protein